MSAPPHRRRGRRRLPRLLLGAVGVAIVFAVGIAVGESLNDNPQGGGTQTLVRTLMPLQLAPAARTTVTVSAP